MKKCIICNNLQEISEYYKHSGMTDGHLNKCKSCCKQQSKEREKILRDLPNWYEKEKKRHREKYYRLGYKEKHKPTSEKKKRDMDTYKGKYPEKYCAKIASQRIPRIDILNENHHWSYNDEHWKDVIELSKQDHSLLHRYIKYDQSVKMYKTLNGYLLDSKESHIKLLSEIKQIENI